MRTQFTLAYDTSPTRIHYKYRNSRFPAVAFFKVRHLCMAGHHGRHITHIFHVWLSGSLGLYGHLVARCRRVASITHFQRESDMGGFQHDVMVSVRLQRPRSVIVEVQQRSTSSSLLT